jgi:ABC-type Fe3+-hydroxamate transport system substrate-binding protein
MKMRSVFNEVLGKDVPIPEEPHRIVSLSPAITESLFLLGLGKEIVGVSAFCARPPEARNKRKVGSYSTTNIDVLRSLKPDLIFTITGYQRPLGLKLTDEFSVYPIALPVSVSGIVDTIIKVGLVVGRVDEARNLASSLLRSLAKLRPVQTRPRVYVEIDLGGPVSFGAYSYIVDAFGYLGASTLFDGVMSEWLTPDLAKVQEMDPDVFVYEAKMYSKFSRNDFERMIDKRGWRGMRAIRSGNYMKTPGPLDFLAHHGPSFITEVLPWISANLSDIKKDTQSQRSGSSSKINGPDSNHPGSHVKP